MSQAVTLLEERQREHLLEELDELLSTRQLRDLVAQLRRLADERQEGEE